MDLKIEDNILSKFNKLNERIYELEREISILKENMSLQQKIGKSHLMRVKNGDELSNDFIVKSSHYMDLSPEKAFELYKQDNLDFILIDVSAKDHTPDFEFPEVSKIPLKELRMRISQIPNKTARMFIISEDGTNSILACHTLHEMGYYNLNNISGGYKFWPGNIKTIKSTASDEKVA